MLNELETTINKPYEEMTRIRVINNFSHDSLNQLSKVISQVANAENKELKWKPQECNQEAIDAMMKTIYLEISARLFPDAILRFSDKYKSPEVVIRDSGIVSELAGMHNDGKIKYNYWCLSQNPISSEGPTNFVNISIK